MYKADNYFAENWRKLPIHSFQGIAYGELEIYAKALGEISTKKVS